MKKSLLLFWNIGKFVDKGNLVCENIYKKCSELCSYYYGMSHVFSRGNIRYMNKFYCSFPIYYSKLEDLSWEHYLLLLDIYDKETRYFYYRVALFCRSSVRELKYLIDNSFYNQIKRDN